MKLFQVIGFLVILCGSVLGQTIKGQFSQMPNQFISLVGFNNYTEEVIGSLNTDAEGKFEFQYNASQFGIGYIKVSDEAKLRVLLNGEDILVKGNNIHDQETIVIEQGAENKTLRTYSIEHPKRLSVLDAWSFLNNYYSFDPQFSQNKNIQKLITEEQNRINNEEIAFLTGLPSDSYCKWFLPINQTLSSIPAIAQYNKDQIAPTLNYIKTIDWTDKRLSRSGMLKDVVEGSIWLIINQGGTQEQINQRMNLAIDHFLAVSAFDEELNKATIEFMYALFGRRNLVSASEYLAVKVINENSCTLDGDIANHLKSYQKMSTGNVADDIQFEGKLIGPGLNNSKLPSSLSAIKSKYKLVIFAASWCPSCRQEIPKLNKHFQDWKNKDIQMVLISLDDNEHNFKDFAHSIPAISHCDYQMWDGKAVKSFGVFNTPSLFLLDEDRKILVRPNSVEHLEEWITKNL